MLPSEVPRLATDLLVRMFPGVWKLLSFWGGWCTRMTQRDGMGREVGGGGSGWGTSVHLWRIHVDGKPIQYCKVIASN